MKRFFFNTNEKVTKKSEYTGDYGGFAGNREKALNAALDIRKFEIDLYWKRATYFWAFNSIIFIGYGAAAVSDNKSLSIQILLSILGTLFSVAWYLANLASKFWQSNWEAHVDLLEDTEIGPLYKRIYTPRPRRPENSKRCSEIVTFLTRGRPFSASKLNALVSLYAVVVWFLLFSRSLVIWIGWQEFITESPLVPVGAIILLVVGCSFLLLATTGSAETEVRFHQRSIEDTDQQ